MSVPAVPAPKVNVLPKSLVTGPPSAVVPSWVCPVLDAKAASSWLNSSFVSAACITSPSVYVDCHVYVAPIYLLAPT